MTASSEAEPWWRDAVCPQIGDDLFFGENGDPGHEGKRICRDMCPVREECLADSIGDYLEYGIFGGFGRETRLNLMQLVARGHAPRDVARWAIKKEQEKRDRQARADHRRWDRRRGLGGDRLRPSA